MEKVAILGASNNPSRYSYKAQIQLAKHEHIVYPVSLHNDKILNTKSYRSLKDIDHKIDTVTVYINPVHLRHTIDDILALHPRRVIFNPGSESTEEMGQLKKAGITVQTACTLVLLSTNQFEGSDY